ncbi:MAG TPA: excinuclease ABC subunit UvrA [Planctomycetota bacterium]
MTAGAIEIRGARQNNLAGVDVDIPRNRLVAITGVSGSGKSSLAFDTLFREGQRRFLETLSAYARQFLGRMEKPDVERISGLSPAIAVDQQAVQRGPRSTVGTVTEIVDHLRVLYARAGVAHCPEHGEPLASQTPEAIVQSVLGAFAGENVHVLAPLVRDRKGEHLALLQDLQRKGFVRVRVDGSVQRIEEVGALARYKRHTLEAVVDRLKVVPEALARLREAVGGALELGQGDVVVLASSGERAWSLQRTCPKCAREAPPLEPRLFSFNSPHGACPRCEGLGLLKRPSPRLVVGDTTRSIREGALLVTRASGGALLFPHVDFAFLAKVGKAHGFDLDTPWRELASEARSVILKGTGEQRYAATASWSGKKYQGKVSFERRYKGVLPALEKAWKQGLRKAFVERFLEERACPDCAGSRLQESARAVRVGNVTLPELTSVAIDALGTRLDGLRLGGREAEIAAPLLTEIRRRLAFLQEVGLGYLALDRSADTLSSGEAQRIRLAAQLGARLQGVLYVLDEPSIGLHARDHGRLFRALEHLRDGGNTVVVVEHDEATLRQADWLIDIGPGAGRHGGRVVAQGTPAAVRAADSPTGKLLRGELALPAPAERRRGNGKQLVLRGAQGFHLKNVDVAFPLGTLTVVSGVSGSGKSTLVHHTLQRAVARHLGQDAPPPEPVERVEGLQHVEELVFLSSAPIGRTPRSNPATYTGAFTPIRDLFASLPEARMRGWEPGRFSFNVAGGRCEACQGAGARFVELQFLAPVTVPCEECGGHRFQAETLEARYKGRSIADVLALTVEEAHELFQDLPKAARPLAALVEVGLGYLQLGQPSTTLSGGEAQRVKLATYLQKRSARHTLYLLDEPTTGLHQADVLRLVAALQRLVDQGHTVVVIEHMLELVQVADHVIDLGPEGGAAGGELLVAGTPEEVARCKRSHTGAALRARLAGTPERDVPAAPAVAPRERLEVFGARTHNLKGIDVSLPRRALTVVTGPSGSGKSSLALDTIHAVGRARFVESLSTYARQFLGDRDRPPVDRIEGLGPSVAVEARTGGSHPRSTVATTTEIHDLFRVLWARAGTPRCPEHGEELARTDAGAVARRILREHAGQKGWLVAPVFGLGGVRSAELPSEYARALEAWKAGGFARVLVDGLERRLDDPAPLPEGATRIDLVLDRLSFAPEARGRLVEALEQAEAIAAGRASVVLKGKDSSARFEYSTKGACTQCGFQLAEPLEPRHFSFNTHVGACPTCDGLGEHWRCAPEHLITHPGRALVGSEEEGGGAIGGKLGRYLTKGKGYYEFLLRTVADEHGLDLERPFGSYAPAEQELLLHGTGARPSYRVKIAKEGASFSLEENFTAAWPGLCGHVDQWHAKSEDPEWRAILERTMRQTTCDRCGGERLAPAPRAVVVGKKRLPEVLALDVDAVHAWLAQLALPARVREGVAPLLAELASRVGLLAQVGLGYVTLDRTVSTLSGGESRRVRLASSLGSKLVDVCYVLDEPTVGLHPGDVARLTDALLALRDGGNTVIVVEHDEALMRRADHVLDLGPRAGRFGGELIASGTPEEVARHPTSLTAAALRGELVLERPTRARDASLPSLRLSGARLHNLRGLDLELSFGELLGLCGPSGSGKSTLVLDCLVPALRGEAPAGRWRSLRGGGEGTRLVVVDASPLGRSPKSIPATAVGILEPLRELYARTPEARARGLSAAYFSFNSTRGRCPACEGRGSVQVEMQFLADLWLTCEECDGKRYQPEVLAVPYRGRSIADVLALPVEGALEFLRDVPEIARPLETLVAVGLGYLGLGQSSTTLSVGEAQRVKLAGELARAAGGARAVIVLDEPTTGLARCDVLQLYEVLRKLVERGDAVLVIEHHVDLLGACDRLVELGPGGGAAGGRLLATGTPAELAADPASVTGPWLRAARGGDAAPARAARRGRKVRA